MKEHGLRLRLDEEAEEKLLAARMRCHWHRRTIYSFRDVVVLVRDTGMRNERHLLPVRIETRPGGSTRFRSAAATMR